ncbi:MAG TPA: hypothetical protein VF605_09860 [Allosphingosinicella sp.]|jgi:hypothetical protein
MFDSVCDLIARPEVGDDPAAARENLPEQASSYTCPHCSYVNWCTFDSGHSGQCHCDQGHYWNGNH